jgi:hypothetical protein
MLKRFTNLLKSEAPTLLLILIMVPTGFYSKLYSGPAALWVNHSLGGTLYVLFWCLVLFLFLPGIRPWLTCTWVLAGTCVLEFLQLWHPPFLTWVRGSFLGQTLVGTTFMWSDFPYYFLGWVLGGMLLSRLGTARNRSDRDS